MKQKRHLFEIQLNSITDTDNPTKSEVEFVIHDFNISHNYAFISKETAEKSLHTLNGMPIVARYHPVSEVGANDDALGSHEMYIDNYREDGSEIVAMNTVPIGVFTENAYIKTIIDNEGNEKEVVVGKGILWTSRFPNVVGLLKEWIDEGINVLSSMEILYDTYRVENGITEVLNYVYEGHCILNSEERGGHNKIYPAYDESKLTKLVAQAINQKDKEEKENMEFFKKVYELSHGDVRSLLYTQLETILDKKEYSYISDVYETYFVVNAYKYDEDDHLEYDKYFKFNYSKDENDTITIDGDSKVEVVIKRDWVEVSQFESIQNEVKELSTQLNEKATEIIELEKQLNAVNSDKQSIEEKFNTASETIIQLNSKVEELTPFKEQFEQQELENVLSEKKEFYGSKFEALNAKEKFESEEVQELISKAIYENDEGSNAILQLNSMLVDMVVLNKETNSEKHAIREVSSKRENLIPSSDDFDSRYSV